MDELVVAAVAPEAVDLAVVVPEVAPVPADRITPGSPATT